MKIIYPSIKYWSECNINPIEHIDRCARICYRSEKKNPEVLVESLWKNNHRSMFRHSSKYYVLPSCVLTEYGYAKYLCENPYVDYILHDNEYYISTNAQYIKEHPEFYNIVGNYEVTAARMFDFAKTFPALYDIIRYTFRCVTQISTSREFNRVSPNNIAEQSTRYVYDDGTICKPHWITDEEAEIYSNDCEKGLHNNKMNFTSYLYLSRCEYMFEGYNILIDNNINKQDARGILPIDTATVVIYTYSGMVWKHILDMRLRGTTGKPHPNAKELAELISNEIETITKGYIK